MQKIQAKMQKKCNFWKFVFVKHAHFQNLHFFRMFFAFVSHFVCMVFCILPRFFAIFEKVEALTKPPPKNAKKLHFFLAFLLAFFFLHFCFFFAFFLHLCFVVAFFLHFLIAFFFCIFSSS